MTIDEWFAKAYPDKSRLLHIFNDKTCLFILFFPNAGFHGLAIELCHDFEPDIEFLNDLGSQNYMSVACKHEEQVRETIAAYMGY